MKNGKSLIKINGRPIGPGHPVYIIAEMSANHNQDFDLATRILKAAKEAGADAVKLQTYTPDTLTIRADTPYFKISGGTLWDGSSLYDLYAKACMPWEWHQKLKDTAEEIGIDLFSTAYDPTAVDYLEKLGVPAHKIASFENVDIPLIRKVARTGKPLIISTGMATLEEIEEAVETARSAGAKEIALLKCTSSYPAPPDSMNLRTIPDLAGKFEVPIGISDHTLGISVSVAAVALGACIIERHIALSRSIPTPDSAFSLEPQEFKAMVEAVRTVEKAVGETRYGINEDEAKSQVFRRSLFVVEDMKAGEVFNDQNVRSIRPGHGLHTRHLEEILGHRAKQNIFRGTPLSWGMIENPPLPLRERIKVRGKRRVVTLTRTLSHQGRGNSHAK